MTNFDSVIVSPSFVRFQLVFMKSTLVFAELYSESRKQSEAMANLKEQLQKKADGHAFYSHLLLTVNTIILLIQLFFNSLFDLFIDWREEKRKGLLKPN